MSEKISPDINGNAVGASPLSLELLLRNLPGAAYRCIDDSDWTMLFISEGVEKLTGYPGRVFTEEPRLPFVNLIHEDDRAAVQQTIAEALLAHESFQLTYRIRCANGDIKWVWEQGALFCQESNGLRLLEGFIADVTQQKDAENLIAEQASFLQQAHDAIIVVNLDGTISYWNDGAQRLYGWTVGEATGRPFHHFICLYDDAYKLAREKVLQAGQWAGELQHHKNDGSTVDVETSWTLLAGDPERRSAPKILMITTDITARKKTEAELYRLAYFDALTGLPNRANFIDRLHQTMATSARSGLYGGLLFCDLDHFKAINDSEGHAGGDRVLQAVAHRLRSCIRESDALARLSGDEFVVLLPPTEASSEAAAAQARAVAEKIVFTLPLPIQINGKDCTVSASVGVTIICGREDTVESVMREADSAMYLAKSGGRNTFRFHDPVLQAIWSARANFDKDLRHALHAQELLLYYQPQLNKNGEVVGAEALLRWHTSSGQLVYPGEFIKAAEETNLIVEVGEWVIRAACAQLARWRESPALSTLTLSVNVSARQFVDQHFVAKLIGIFNETDVDPSKLKLEMTETLMISDFDKTATTMMMLRARGVRFSLDDFGTGYSSLATLRKLPLDQIKIDQTFVRGVLNDDADASIVRSIIALGENLGLQVIAEGVESLEQQQFLAAAGCTFYQGFLYNPALPVDSFNDYAYSAGLGCRTLPAD